MAKKKESKPKKKSTPPNNTLDNIVKKQFRFLSLIIFLIFIVALGLIGAYFYFVRGTPVSGWLIDALIMGGPLALFGILALVTISLRSSHAQKLVSQAAEREMGELRAATRRAESLQEMASTMRTTLNFERVVEAAMDACTVVMEEFNVPPKSMVGAVFTYEGGGRRLTPVAERQLEASKHQFATGQQGVIAEALQYAEPIVTNDPRNDPELQDFQGLRKCKTAVVIPLRVGFDLYGVMIVGSQVQITVDAGHLELFTSVADQAVIALRNAQLYEDVEKQKQRLIDTSNEERKQLARALHDGPTQSVAAIAMRINFVRSLLKSEPQMAADELAKVEELAKNTGKEIRGMLFTLRPLLVVDQGLSAALEKVIERLHESDGLNITFLGGEYGDLLSQQAQMTVFQIVEEALGNARKYSRAKSIDVRFWQEADLFVARVQDDGVGFDVDSVMDGYSERGSLGMINMEERAKMIDGSIQVESAVGQGTAITLVVPLDKHGQRANS
ncbi:MAG: GAF domain-containing sensor histidine kinase [Anaerolineales bacterium]|nr:GAF domain-containing sensor histidine kinase [Anaerolineales bacterium]